MKATIGGAVAALALVAAGILVPGLTGWDVKSLSLPPLFAEFRPRLGVGSAPALVMALAVGVWGLHLAHRAPWALLLALTGVTSAIWMLCIDAIDGFAHLGSVLDSAQEYLPSARDIAGGGPVTGVSVLLQNYVDRIPLASPDNLPVHLAGHPPAAVLFFTVLVSLGANSSYAVGLVVTVLAATIPLAVLSTCRSLGAEAAARSIAPVLATAPAAIWMAVSADAVFAAVGAWGVAALSRGAAGWRPSGKTNRARAWALVAGLLFGLGAFMSYGFPLLGLVVLAVLLATSNWWILPWVIGSSLFVVAAFTLGGFSWWEAYPVLQQRYWDGFASLRPAAYWMWANLAALVCATGPALGGGLVGILRRLPEAVRGILRRVPEAARGATSQVRVGSARPPIRASSADSRVLTLLSLSAVAMVILADVSNMSRGEVERIWLFIVPWLLVSVAAVPARAQQWMLALNLAFGLGLAHLAQSAW